jgi:alpha-beta hydrolase superfamily lysophospholipase
MVRHVKAGSGAERMFLFGHSMGGAVLGQLVTSRTLDPIIQGLLFSGPAMAIERSLIVNIKLALGGVLGSALPKLTLPTGLDSNNVSSDPAEVKRYQNDPLVHDKISAALGLSIKNHGEALPAQAGKVTLPTLVWNGGDDRIVDHAGTRAWVKNLGTSDHLYREFPGGRHELHHERAEIRTAVFDMIKGWLAPRLLAP